MLLVAALVMTSGGPVWAEENAKKLSDKAVSKIMALAWQLMPGKIKTEDGNVIKIDRKNPKDVIIPMEDARRIIMTARLSAHAQICDLRDLQVANYRALMKQEIARKKWNRKQIVYINQLHLFTVMLVLGNVNVRREGEENKPLPAPKKQVCTEAQRKQVKEKIEAFLKTAAKS